MARGDGNGWVHCRCGRTHWGRYGAAGLVLLRREQLAAAEVLLQLRAGWTHEGGSWALPGGARDSDESVAQAALREALEEAGVPEVAVRVLGTQVGVDHVDWRYTYVLGLAVEPLSPRPTSAESDELRWVPVETVPSMTLHSGLANAWTALAGGISTTLAGLPPTGTTG